MIASSKNAKRILEDSNIPEETHEVAGIDAEESLVYHPKLSGPWSFIWYFQVPAVSDNLALQV